MYKVICSFCHYESAIIQDLVIADIVTDEHDKLGGNHDAVIITLDEAKK